MYDQALTFMGFRVQLAVTGDPQVAADAALLTQPDIVLTRILPGVFGIELIRLLRRSDAMPNVPIVVLTSLGQPAMHNLAREAGATDVLLLPKTPEQVATALHAAIKSAQTRRPA